MTEHDGASGCSPAGAFARLVLAYAPVVMGASVGRWLDLGVAPGAGTPYAGALLGGGLGLIIGLVLALRGATGRGRAGRLADLALCLGAVVWLVGIGLRATGGAPAADLATVWAVTVGGLAAVAVLLR